MRAACVWGRILTQKKQCWARLLACIYCLARGNSSVSLSFRSLAAPSCCAFHGGALLVCSWSQPGKRLKPSVNSGKPQLLQQPLGGCCSWRQFWTVWSSSKLLSGVPAGPCLGWKVWRFLRILVLLWEVATKYLHWNIPSVPAKERRGLAGLWARPLPVI